MEIRLLNTEDASEWLRLRVESLRESPEAFGASLEEYESLSVEEVKKRLWAAPEAFVVGAFQDRQLIGIAGFYRSKGEKERHKGHVWGVYIAPAARGQGVARDLMQKLLERVQVAAGVEQVMVSVTSTQAAAANLYRSLGFTPYGVEPRALKIGDRYVDEEHMVLRCAKQNRS